MGRIKLDLHDIFNNDRAIDKELRRVIDEAVEKRVSEVEIIPGKGSGQLKKRVLRFLEQPDIKRLYHRLEKDDKNFGRLFVHFRH
jgi:dsDNA-specific endonuclease/ATPase MutS2